MALSQWAMLTLNTHTAQVCHAHWSWSIHIYELGYSYFQAVTLPNVPSGPLPSSGLVATCQQMGSNEWLSFAFSWLLAVVGRNKALVLSRTEFTPIHLLSPRQGVKVHFYVRFMYCVETSHPPLQPPKKAE